MGASGEAGMAPHDTGPPHHHHTWPPRVSTCPHVGLLILQDLGEGGTDSLSLDTGFGNYSPIYWSRTALVYRDTHSGANEVSLMDYGQPLVLPSPNLQPPLFMEAQGQPPQIVTFRWIYLKFVFT